MMLPVRYPPVSYTHLVHLTPIEYKLLCLLAKNVGKVLTHNFILKEVWGSALPGDTPSLLSLIHISHVRHGSKARCWRI